MTFVDPVMKTYVLNYSGWDTNGDRCLSPKEADAVTMLKSNSIGKIGNSFDGTKIQTLEDLNKFRNLKRMQMYSVNNCNLLKTVLLTNVKTLDTYSLDQDRNIETLALPLANHFDTYFADDLRNLKHLFLTAPGNFEYEIYSFLALTKDVRQPNWSNEMEMGNKNVTLYLSRDKRSKASPKIISSTEWGDVFKDNVGQNQTWYHWKAIYVCDDYATDISSCELVK